MEEILRAFQQASGQNQEQHSNAPLPKWSVKRLIVSLVITLVFGAVHFYLSLPALNFHSGDIYRFILLLLVVFCVCMVPFRSGGPVQYVRYIRKRLQVPFWIAIALIAFVLIGSITGWVLFRSKSYAKLLPIETGDFAAEVEQISFDQIPMLDSASANVLANRKLGELADLVSQFEVDSSSVQINYRDRPVRVAYLNYGDFFKWINNRSEGIPAYLITDMVTQEVTVVRLKEGMRYTPSERFGRKLERHLRFHYPTLIFNDITFEVDDEGAPWWLASVCTKTIGLFGGEDTIGAVLVNAVTGESTYYSLKDIPEWCDRVFNAELIIQQYDYYGRYHNGYWNSLFGQRDVTVTTDGYNYIAQSDDVWLYTGITSVGTDEGNIGFILVNQRTKEARYYSCAGAEEYSAMNSAEGAVQQYHYDATFPLLLNIGGQPTYFMALKDYSNLVKQYAMVNVQQYQVVATGNTVASCEQNYLSLLAQNGIRTQVSEEVLVQEEYDSVEGVIGEIRAVTIDGNTVFFIRIEGYDEYYRISAKDEIITVILSAGDSVAIEYIPSDGEIRDAVSVERIS